MNLVVRPGELVAVMGPSGSGKSTLLSLAGGLDSPSGGEVVIEDTPLASQSEAQLAAIRRRSVGYVFQDYNLIPALTAAENVGLPRELDGVSARKARAEALAAWKKWVCAPRPTASRTRCRAVSSSASRSPERLIGERRLILTDEPTGALDTETGETVLRLLRKRCDEGAAGVLVTHEARHAAWADRIVFIRDGLIVDESAPSQHAEDLLVSDEAQA